MKKQNDTNKITRKDAIKKMGKYAALTAVGTFVILNPLQAQRSSPGQPSDPGGNPFPGNTNPGGGGNNPRG